MSLPALSVDGFLPLGRWHATLPELQAAFVDGQDPVRSAIWNDFHTALNTLTPIVHVCAMWLSGSFLSAKSQPGDLDCVYIVDERTRPTTPNQAAVFDLFVTNQLGPRFGLKLDTFVVGWHYRPGTAPTTQDELSQLALRGYWDDFWQRRRHGPKGSVHADDALPERGYVEVMGDGYKVAVSS